MRLVTVQIKRPLPRREGLRSHRRVDLYSLTMSAVLPSAKPLRGTGRALLFLKPVACRVLPCLRLSRFAVQARKKMESCAGAAAPYGLATHAMQSYVPSKACLPACLRPSPCAVQTRKSEGDGVGRRKDRPAAAGLWASRVTPWGPRALFAAP